MKKIFILIAVIFCILPAIAQAAEIPPHLASMAAQLYKDMEADLKSKTLSPERRKILDESIKTLESVGVHRWSAKPAEVGIGLPEVAEKLQLDLDNKGDWEALAAFMRQRADEGSEKALAAFEKKTRRPVSQDERNKKAVEIDGIISASQEKLKTRHKTAAENGRAVEMKWKPETNRFFMKVFDDGSGGSEEFATTFSGDVESTLSEDGKEMALGVDPSSSALGVVTEKDIESMRGNILGEWRDEKAGETYIFSASKEEIGEILPPREVFDSKIEQKKEKIKSIKDKKIFKWQHPDTGKIVKQEKYRRLKEPYEFLGEEYALDDAEAKIAGLEAQIKELEVERDGGKLPPVDSHDPAGFKEVSGSSGAGAITVSVTRDDGYSYTYDQAAFDGRRISAKRTYRNFEDVENEKLPDRIRHQLIDNGWNPPGWLDLEALIDAETGDLVLEGSKWALHVTYSSFFGDPPDVDSIHTPFAYGRVLRKEGMAYEVAEGAPGKFVP